MIKTAHLITKWGFEKVSPCCNISAKFFIKHYPVAYVAPTRNSDSSFSNDNFEIEFVEEQQGKSMKILIYLGHMKFDGKKDRWKNVLNKAGLKNISVVIYTNNDKNKLTYIESNESLKLDVNPRAARRNKDEKQYLYALCQHVGAATAALHFIASLIHPHPHTLTLKD
jgi:hypothetical protein